MAIYASDNGGGDFTPVSEGTHIAICDMVVDCGVQPGGRFDPKHKIYLRWQIPGERVEFEKDGVKVNKPAVVGGIYTLSLSEKSNLRPLLQAWRGRAFTPEELKKFDITTVAGAPCMINVTHEHKDGKTFANVTGVMKLPNGTPPPQIEGEVIIYDSDHLENFDKLRPWLQDKIRAAVKADDLPEERGPVHSPQPAFAGDLDDDVPF